MIPRKIHYCAFGNSPETELMRRCLDSWGRVLPDYHLQIWNEANSPMHVKYLENAARHKKWANMSNFVRLYALLVEGGIYLDTDVEVIKSFDPFLMLPAFVGCESKTPRVNNAVCGSEQGHPFLAHMLSELSLMFDGTENASKSSPGLLTLLLRRLGLGSYSSVPQMVADVTIFPTEYFYPFHFDDEFHADCITPNTVTIHYWAKRW